MTLTFKDLIASPPALKKTTAILPDGREYELHQLPMGAVIRVGDLSRMAAEKKQELPLKEFGAIAAQAVLGKPPKPKEVKQFIEVMGNETVAHIYKQAITFSQLGAGAIDEAKKD